MVRDGKGAMIRFSLSILKWITPPGSCDGSLKLVILLKLADVSNDVAVDEWGGTDSSVLLAKTLL